LHLTAGRKLEGDPIANPQCVKKKNSKISLHYLEMVPKKKKEKGIECSKNHPDDAKTCGRIEELWLSCMSACAQLLPSS
jgi:hypothetical protein